MLTYLFHLNKHSFVTQTIFAEALNAMHFNVRKRQKKTYRNFSKMIIKKENALERDKNFIYNAYKLN